MIKQIISLLKVQFQVMVNNFWLCQGKNHFSLLLPMLLFSYLSVMYTIAYSHESIEPRCFFDLGCDDGIDYSNDFYFSGKIRKLV